jgi:hypothetical protein
MAYTPISDTSFYKGNEFNYLIEKGWIEAGAVDPTKWKLSADGIARFEQLIEHLDAEMQVLVRMQVAGNAEKSTVEVKAFMQ